MESLLLLVPVALLLIVLAVKLFFWAVKDGQFDDLNTEGQRILFDDEAQPQPQPKNSDSESPPPSAPTKTATPANEDDK